MIYFNGNFIIHENFKNVQLFDRFVIDKSVNIVTSQLIHAKNRV